MIITVYKFINEPRITFLSRSRSISARRTHAINMVPDHWYNVSFRSDPDENMLKKSGGVNVRF